MRWDKDYALHFAGGAAIAAIILPSSPWWAPSCVVLLLLGWGIFREAWQHDWVLPLSPHQWLEALTWPAGALPVAIVGLVLHLV